MQEYDMRRYGRGKHFICTAKVSTDCSGWKSTLVNDISSGGLNFVHLLEYMVGDVLWIEMYIEGFFSAFNFLVQGRIRHKTPSGEGFIYGVEFLDLPHSIKVQIDLNVREDRPVSGEPYSQI